VATWKPANQRRSDSLLKPTDMADDRLVSKNSFVNDVNNSSRPLNAMNTVQTSAKKRMNDVVCRVSSVGNEQSSPRDKASQVSRGMCFDKNANVRQDVVGGRRRGRGRGSSSVLTTHPRRLWAGVKWKSSTSKLCLGFMGSYQSNLCCLTAWLPVVLKLSWNQQLSWNFTQLVRMSWYGPLLCCRYGIAFILYFT